MKGIGTLQSSHYNLSDVVGLRLLQLGPKTLIFALHIQFLKGSVSSAIGLHSYSFFKSHMVCKHKLCTFIKIKI